MDTVPRGREAAGVSSAAGPQGASPHGDEATIPAEVATLLRGEALESRREAYRAIGDLARIVTGDPAGFILAMLQDSIESAELDDEDIRSEIAGALRLVRREDGGRPLAELPGDAVKASTRDVLAGVEAPVSDVREAAADLASVARDARTPVEFIARLLGPIARRTPGLVDDVRRQLEIAAGTSDDLGPCFVDGALKRRRGLGWLPPAGGEADEFAAVRAALSGEVSDAMELHWAARDLAVTFEGLDLCYPENSIVGLLIPAADAIGVPRGRLRDMVANALAGVNVDYRRPGGASVRERLVEAALCIARAAVEGRDKVNPRPIPVGLLAKILGALPGLEDASPATAKEVMQAALEKAWAEEQGGPPSLRFPAPETTPAEPPNRRQREARAEGTSVADIFADWGDEE